MAISAMTARFVVGVIGNFLSFILYLSPLPTIYKIMKLNSVQEFKPDPYLATTLNCAIWLVYGMPFVHPNSTLILTINSTGLAIELFYVSIFLVYSHSWTKRLKIVMTLLVEAVFVAVVAVIAVTVFHTTKERSMVVGLVCVVCGVIMYASPLTVMVKVLKTKSVEFMPLYLSVANFLNALAWLVYGLIKFDLYMTVPNGLGVLFGGVQLVLQGIYWRSTKEEEEGEKDVSVKSLDEVRSSSSNQN